MVLRLTEGTGREDSLVVVERGGITVYLQADNRPSVDFQRREYQIEVYGMEVLYEASLSLSFWKSHYKL